MRGRLPLALLTCSAMHALTVIGAAPNDLGAQQVHVELRADAMPSTLQGVLVSLINERDSTVAEGLTDARGARTLVAATAGKYRVRLRRIGFAPIVSDPIELASSMPRTLTLSIPSTRVVLPTITVTAMRKECSGRDDNALAASTVWEQLQTALAAGEASRSDALVRTRVRTFERQLTAGGLAVDASSRDLGISGAHPFATPDPGELSRRGYVVTDAQNVTHYYGPDARVLLSREFETDHCFGVVAGAGADSGRLGLAFRPVHDRGVPDIEGTLWMAKATLELERLEFQYVHVHLPADARLVGGRVEFERVQSGAWFPRYWVLRMPRVRESPTNPGLFLLAGYVEIGATATAEGQIDTRAMIAGTRPSETPRAARVDTIGDDPAVHRAAPRPGSSIAPLSSARAACGRLGRAGTPTAAGLVREPTGTPIPFATVSFEGYQTSTISDRTGCFIVASPRAGELTLVTRRIGYREDRRSVALRADSTTFFDVRLDPIAVTVHGMTVTAPRDKALEVTGFYDRVLDRKKGLGDGWFITPEEIERRRASKITQLLEGFPSIVLRSGRGPMHVMVPMGKGGDCVMALYVDGARFYQSFFEATAGTSVDARTQHTLAESISRTSALSLDDAVGPTAVAAIEIYPRAAEAPPQFQPLNGACGVIVVWTKR